VFAQAAYWQISFSKSGARQMNYKGIDYSILPTTNPATWKWTVYLENGRTKSGDAPDRRAAAIRALAVINRAAKGIKMDQ
jgi:hypothetical protein